MNLLLTFFDGGTKRLTDSMGHNILLDSGAFSAYKRKEKVNFQEYCAFVKDPPFKVERYFMLDIIGDPIATERNLQIMLDKGLNPIPVFQRGQSLDKLYKLQEQFDLIGIGGVAGTNNRDEYLKFILQRPDINKRKLHLLGVLDMDLLKQYKPRSCDSTFIVDSGKFALITYFNERENKVSRIGKQIVKNRRLMSKLPEEIQFGLLDSKGWIHTWKDPLCNMHFKASLHLFTNEICRRIPYTTIYIATDAYRMKYEIPKERGQL